MTDVEGMTEESLSRSVSDLKSKMDRLNYVLKEECFANMKICTRISFELCGKMRTNVCNRYVYPFDFWYSMNEYVK